MNNFNSEEQSVASLISLSIKKIKRIVQYDEKINGFLDKFLNIQKVLMIMLKIYQSLYLGNVKI